MNNVDKNKNYLRLDPTFITYLSLIATIFVSFSFIFQQSYSEDYKLNIVIKNEDDVNTKTDVSIKTDDDTKETTVKLNDNPEKIKEEISGKPGDKVKVWLEESNDSSKYYQTIMSLSQYYQLNKPKFSHYHQYIMHP